MLIEKVEMESLKEYLPFFLLIISVFLVIPALSGSEEVERGEVVVPPHSFIEWSINVPRGAIIDVVVNTYINKNDSLKKVVVVLIFDEKAYSLYIQGIDLLISKPHGNRMFVEAWGTSSRQFRVPHTDRWHVVLDNQYWVSDKNLEKPAYIHVSVSMPYIYMLYPGLIFLFLGLAILIRRKVLSNR